MVFLKPIIFLPSLWWRGLGTSWLLYALWKHSAWLGVASRSNATRASRSNATRASRSNVTRASRSNATPAILNPFGKNRSLQQGILSVDWSLGFRQIKIWYLLSFQLNVLKLTFLISRMKMQSPQRLSSWDQLWYYWVKKIATNLISKAKDRLGPCIPGQQRGGIAKW